MVEVIPGPEFSKKQIHKFFTRRIQSQGVLQRRPLEFLKIYPQIWRPFRRVRWERLTETGHPVDPCYTFLDEQCASLEMTPVEQLLLWRPKYAALDTETLEGTTNEIMKNRPNEANLQKVISQVVKDWQISQITISSLTPALRKTQYSTVTALGAFIPRTPSRRHREHELVEDRKHSQALLMALSMMLNCPDRYVIQKGILEKRVGVGTIIGEYEHLEDHSKRYLVLETAGARNLAEALRNGRALTRLLFLNQNCETSIKESI